MLSLLACINCSCTTFTPCPNHSITLSTGAKSVSECVCEAGYYGSPCTLCPPNYYCPLNSTTPLPCPFSPLPAILSWPGSTSIHNCSCPPAHVGQNNTCMLCPATKYIESDICTLCPETFYCPGDGRKYLCATGTLCPSGTAGVGLQCRAGFYFQPKLTTINFSDCTAIFDRYFATKTAIYTDNTKLIGSTSGCDHGQFTHITGMAGWNNHLFVADFGCATLVSVDLETKHTNKILQGYQVRGVTLLSPGLLLVLTDYQLIEVNPNTNQDYVVGHFTSTQSITSATNSTSAYIATENTIMQWENGFLNLVATVAEYPEFVISPQQHILYSVNSSIYQITPAGTTVDFTRLVGVEPYDIEEQIQALAWVNGYMFIATQSHITNVTLCHMCPTYSTTFGNELGISRCRCALGMILWNYECIDCWPGFLCTEEGPQLCPAGFFCTLSKATICPAGTYCVAGSSAPVPCPLNLKCAKGSEAPGDSCEIGYAFKNYTCEKCGSGSSDGLICLAQSGTSYYYLIGGFGSFFVLSVLLYLILKPPSRGHAISLSEDQIAHIKHF